METMTRKEAKAKGLKKYFTGKPCPHGHIDYRRVHSSVCMECIRIAGRSWYQKRKEYKLEKSHKVYLNNRENVLSRTKAYQKANRAKAYLWTRNWAKRNPEKARQISNSYRRLHPEKVYVWNKTQRAKRKKSYGIFTKNDVLDRLKWQQNRCAACRKYLSDDFHVDHYIPLSRGGHNNPSNIQLLCKPCNHSKHAKDPIDFYREMGFLL